MTTGGATRGRSHLIAREWGIDATILVCACASLIAACIVWSPQKLMWEDEILTQMMLTDRSIGHMVRAISAGADSAPPLYHLLGRVWIALWGPSPLSLRMFSSVGICTALVILWITLRKCFGRVATALGVLPIFVMPATLLRQNVEVRYYGVLLSLAALAILVTLHVMSQPAGIGRRLWVANALTIGALVLTHLYGGLYSALLCIACVTYDAIGGRWRPTVYASYLAGWAAFIPWIGPFLRQSAMAQGKSWIPMPTLSDLISSYQFGIRWLPFIVIVAVLIAPLIRPQRAADAPSNSHAAHGAPYLLVAGALLFAPILSFAVSHILTPVFYDRYLMPASFAWAMIVAWIADRPQTLGTRVSARAARALRFAGIAATGAVVAFLVVLPFRYARVTPKMPNWPAQFEALSVDGKPATDFPIGVEDVEAFLQFRYYTSRGRYTYLVDSAVADGVGAAPRAIVELNLLKIFERFGYLAPSNAMPMQETAGFLCSHRRFIVFDDPALGWYEARIAGDPNWHSRTLGFLGRDTARFVWTTQQVDSLCVAAPAQARRHQPEILGLMR